MSGTFIEKLKAIDVDVPSREELKKLLQDGLHFRHIAGPMYHTLNKKFAYLHLRDKQDDLAIFHLTESHGCSLRHQATYRYEVIQRPMEKTDDDNIIKTMASLREAVDLNSDFTSLRYKGLVQRLSELPSEWTVVQITMGYDPLLRFTQWPTKPCDCVHITRMSCGDIAKSINKNRQGGPPFTVCLTPDPSRNTSDALTILEALTKLQDCRKDSKTVKKKSTLKEVQDYSNRLKKMVTDFDHLLCQWSCLLPGLLVDAKLQKKICGKVDKMISDLSLDFRERDSRSRQILYMWACCTVSISGYVDVLERDVGITEHDQIAQVKKYMRNLRKEYESVLSIAPRHPVILIIDELLDQFPFEVLDVLKIHPVSRVPSIHFLHALYREHADSTLESGIDGNNGYYIINPAGDLMNCETVFREVIPVVCPKWKGLFGKAPSEEEYKNALQNHAIFLYCGHGGGNQYVANTGVERLRTKAMAFLFGCSSNRIISHGGRTEGHSIFNSYTIAGCPCVVGMLWDVYDTDVNRMTAYFLKTWLLGDSTTQSLEDLMKRLAINDQRENNSSSRNLLSILAKARTQGRHYYNSAALVARGLPLQIRRKN